jgi:hypothetical protein
MSAERKADVEAAIAKLEFELELAIRQGGLDPKFAWMAILAAGSWFAVLTVGKVGDQ